MHLARLEIENYRAFGSRDDGAHLGVDLQPGLTLFVGENDSGKTCLIDALRVLLGTTPWEYFPLREEDFHCRHGARAKTLTISAEFQALSEAEAGAFLEYLTIGPSADPPEYSLRVWLRASLDHTPGRSPRRSPVRHEFRAGPDELGLVFQGPARELLRATYLRPLRDADAELAPRKGSRLSQILHSYPELRAHETCDWDVASPDAPASTITGIMRKAEHDIRTSPAVQGAQVRLNSTYLHHLSIGDQPLEGRIGMSTQELRHILERMELTLSDQEPGATRGLGHQNILFMSAELLALERDSDPCLRLVLLEEPEAHLHPQLQLRLVDFLNQETSSRSTAPPLQVLMSSHSPNISSKVGVERTVIMHRGRAFPLRQALSRLEGTDYEFLSRFLDATKADLFFARGLLIVEGDGEALLLPTLAELLGRPLTAHGVSVVNVGTVGLFRYARIFQRQDNASMPVNVACLADRDLPPPEARSLISASRETEDQVTGAALDQWLDRKRQAEGGSVRVFISPRWTLEYDLAESGLAREVHVAVTMARYSRSRARPLLAADRRQAWAEATRSLREWHASGKSASEIACLIYAPLADRKASKSETAQFLARILMRHARRYDLRLRTRLPRYLVEAIDYATRHPSPPAHSPTAAAAATLAPAGANGHAARSPGS